MPKVPTIALPIGRILYIQEKINAREKIVRNVAPNTLLLVKAELYFLDSKADSYSSIDSSKSS